MKRYKHQFELPSGNRGALEVTIPKRERRPALFFRYRLWVDVSAGIALVAFICVVCQINRPVVEPAVVADTVSELVDVGMTGSPTVYWEVSDADLVIGGGVEIDGTTTINQLVLDMDDDYATLGTWDSDADYDLNSSDVAADSAPTYDDDYDIGYREYRH